MEENDVKTARVEVFRTDLLRVTLVKKFGRKTVHDKGILCFIAWIFFLVYRV